MEENFKSNEELLNELASKIDALRWVKIKIENDKLDHKSEAATEIFRCLSMMFMASLDNSVISMRGTAKMTAEQDAQYTLNRALASQFKLKLIELIATF